MSAGPPRTALSETDATGKWYARCLRRETLHWLRDPPHQFPHSVVRAPGSVRGDERRVCRPVHTGGRLVRDNWRVNSTQVLAEAPRSWKGLEMLMWVVVIVVVATVVLLAKWMDHSRGSQGASRSLDLPGSKDGRPRHIDTNDGFNGM